MKFDIILSNPPYQTNLHLAFLAKALQHLKKDGVCISLQPTSWLKSGNKALATYSRYAQIIQQHLVSVETISKDYAGQCFSDATMTSDLGIHICAKDKCNFKLQNSILSGDIIKAILAESATAEQMYSEVQNDRVKMSLFSQYFTKPDLAMKMLQKVQNIEDKCILDMSAGIGNLLAAAIFAGAAPSQCYGIELDQKLVDFCRRRLKKFGVPEQNIICGNSLDNKAYNFQRNEGTEAVHITLGKLYCIVKYIDFPAKVKSCHKIDLSYSIGKDLLRYILEDARKNNLQVVFNERTTLESKVEGSVSLSLVQLKQLAESNKDIKTYKQLKELLISSSSKQ